MSLHGFHGQKALINSYIWLALGAVIGAFVGGVIRKGGKTEMIEGICVGVMGAFIGGEFLATQFKGADPVAGFPMSLGLATAAACAALAILAVFRRAIGPLRAGKSRQKNRG